MPSRPSRVRTGTAITLIFLSLALLGSCAGPRLVPDSPAGIQWRKFTARRSAAQSGVRALDVSASINLATPERKTRLLIEFRGNLDYPLRLDLTTGFGAPVAFSREDRFGFIAYDPNANTAFISEDGRRGARILGLALPFDLKDLAYLSSGSFPELLPEAYVRAEPAGEGWTYRFDGNRDISGATLDASGRLTELTGNSVDGPWTMTLEDYSEEVPQEESRPGKLVFTAGKDVKAVLRIKDMRLMAEKWPAESLELPIPPGARLRPIDP